MLIINYGIQNVSKNYLQHLEHVVYVTSKDFKVKGFLERLIKNEGVTTLDSRSQ